MTRLQAIPHMRSVTDQNDWALLLYKEINNLLEPRVLKFKVSPEDQPGLYCVLGTTGTVPRSYNIFKAYEGMEGRTYTN
jgi:hypothetical protein